MSDYYTESQMQRIEQAAYDGTMLEAGKEWERQRYEFGATEAKLAERIAELEAVIDQLIEVSEKMFTAVIAAAEPYDEGMREWDKIVNDWKEG